MMSFSVLADSTGQVFVGDAILKVSAASVCETLTLLKLRFYHFVKLIVDN